MSTAEQAFNRRSIANWPSGRLVDFAEEHVGDDELLGYIRDVLISRDVEVATAAARRVTALMARGRQAAPAPEPADGSADLYEENRAELAAVKARLEQAERRLREAEARASAAERALASEALPSRGGGLLRRVHLADTAPIWLVDAARRAFRLRFHPDRFADPTMKARAEETFKEAEETFRQIVSTGQ